RQRVAVVGAAEQGAQVGFELVRRVVVTRDRQHRPVVRVGRARDRPRQRCRRPRGPPVRTLLARARQRRDREGRGWIGHEPPILLWERRKPRIRIAASAAPTGPTGPAPRARSPAAAPIRGGSRATPRARALAGCPRRRRRRPARASCPWPSALAAASGGGPCPCRR